MKHLGLEDFDISVVLFLLQEFWRAQRHLSEFNRLDHILELAALIHRERAPSFLFCHEDRIHLL